MPVENIFQTANELIEMDKRNNVLWDALKTIDRRVSLRKNFAEKDSCELLNVACGQCEESRVLTAFWSFGMFDMPTRRANLTGVDHNDRSLEMASELAETPSPTNTLSFPLSPSCEFISMDATKLKDNTKLRPSYDVVFMRHPHVLDESAEDAWKQIFSAAVSKLQKESVLIVTCFTDLEKEQVNDHLIKLGITISLIYRNKNAIHYENNPEVSFDRWIIIGTK